MYNRVFYKCKTECLIFQLERYLQKSKNLGGTIKHFNVPRFIPKNKTEKKDTNINLKKRVTGAPGTTSW